MTLYEKGYQAGRSGKPCDAENPKVNQWFAAGWYDGVADKNYLETGIDTTQRV